MMPVWLVLITLASPGARPEFVTAFKGLEDCASAAVARNQRSYMPLYNTPTPKGKAYMCLQYKYPT